MRVSKFCIDIMPLLTKERNKTEKYHSIENIILSYQKNTSFRKEVFSKNEYLLLNIT